MAFEYRAQITVTKMAGNGDVYKKCFNGTCTVGVNKKIKGSIAKKAEAYLHAVEKSQKHRVTRSQKPNMPRLEVVSRVAAIPIVESGIGVTEKLYFKIKESNPLFRWYLSFGEKSLATGLQLAMPAVQMLETPINQLDRFLCKSLDVVEKRVPSIYMPPQAYVLRRADSVKQLGEAVLDSRVTAATATALDRALTTADKYVDKYLPPDNQDAADGKRSNSNWRRNGTSRNSEEFWGPKHDDIDNFFISMAKSLKKLPPYLQVQTKRKVLNVILEAEEQHIQNTWYPQKYGRGVGRALYMQ
ncbi:hypothetical protein O3G_MSEX001962 [Manduca sexta]|uniref:BESS domain-containing protein n=1 Tax=Manduca sexta TaxID=7130 RepID=A0A921YN31_MANSE|nr:hypothetical protein O3G_MSEX001962 [Manduca sexta]